MVCCFAKATLSRKYDRELWIIWSLLKGFLALCYLFLAFIDLSLLDLAEPKLDQVLNRNYYKNTSFYPSNFLTLEYSST